MELKYMHALKEYYTTASVNTESWKVPEKDVLDMENELLNGKKFPAAYRELLLFTGKDVAGLTACVWSFKYLKEMQEQALENLEENELENFFQRDYWVFASDGDCIWYFYFDEGENPPVYFLQMEAFVEFNRDPDFDRKVVDTFQYYIELSIPND